MLEYDMCCSFVFVIFNTSTLKSVQLSKSNQFVMVLLLFTQEKPRSTLKSPSVCTPVTCHLFAAGSPSGIILLCCITPPAAKQTPPRGSPRTSCRLGEGLIQVDHCLALCNLTECRHTTFCVSLLLYFRLVPYFR